MQKLHDRYKAIRPQSLAGWSVQDSMTSQLVADALMMAVWRRGKPLAVLHHSAQGSRYTSKQFHDLLKEHSVAYSMSHAGEVWDNSVIESFFGSMKAEWVLHTCPSVTLPTSVKAYQ